MGKGLAPPEKTRLRSKHIEPERAISSAKRISIAKGEYRVCFVFCAGSPPRVILSGVKRSRSFVSIRAKPRNEVTKGSRYPIPPRFHLRCCFAVRLRFAPLRMTRWGKAREEGPLPYGSSRAPTPTKIDILTYAVRC